MQFDKQKIVTIVKRDPLSPAKAVQLTCHAALGAVLESFKGSFQRVLNRLVAGGLRRAGLV